MFDEYDDKGRKITRQFEMFIEDVEFDFNVSFKEPAHDLARRFLNEIVEFNPLEGEGEE